MPVSVTLPALGESVTEGTVTRWLKQVGDTVQADEPLLEVSTDKVDTEIPAPASGVLTQITVGEDETVAVGAELAIISEDSNAGAPAPAPEQQAPAAEPEPEPEPAQPQPAAQQAAQEQAPQPEAEPAPQAAAGADGQADGTSVTLPALGESVTEGTVTRWLKQVGDTVQADEPLLEVSTDKVDTEIPAPASGTLVRITVGEDETVQVGAELGVIASEAGAAPAAAPRHAGPPPAEEPEPQEQAAPAQPAPQPAAQRQPAQQQTAQTATVPPQVTPSSPAPAPVTTSRTNGDGAAGAGAQYVTPLVRKLATEHNIDLGTINGTGVGGRIRKQDVLEAAKARDAAAAQAAPPPAAASAAPAPSASVEPSPLRGTTEKLSRMRRIIAERMVEALHTAAQLTTVVEVDVTAIARVRDKVKNSFVQREGVKLSFLPFFAKATIDALKEHPKLNASIDTEKGEVTYHDAENLIIAVDTERGLMVPVIHNAGDLSVTGLAKKIADLAERTRTNKITPDELYGGTFTITNTGSRGALFDTPIFTPPQVAMLGTGTVVKRPVVIDTPQGETIAIRHMLYLALSYDHRLVDGADAARFLTAIKKRLEDGSVAAEFTS
ncbi:2-oxo acid dehydrogenase subunit E2 [Flindersiella endophytica]